VKSDQSITTANIYCNQLDEMMKEFAIKQSRLINRDRSIFLQDNALSHVT